MIQRSDVEVSSLSSPSMKGVAVIVVFSLHLIAWIHLFFWINLSLFGRFNGI
jgi:hypothetical protein